MEETNGEAVRSAIRNALNEDDFRKWLLSRHPDDMDRMAGFAHSPAQCPLAQYLRNTNGQVCVYTRSLVAWAWQGEGLNVEIELPEWARRFVREVDRAQGAHPSYRGCLQILDGAAW